MLSSSLATLSKEANIDQNCDDKDMKKTSSNGNQSTITVLESPIQEGVTIDE